MIEASPAPLAASVTIVTYNSARYIGQCLRYLLQSETSSFDVIVVDNASSDDTRRILDEFGSRIQVIRNVVNKGFSGGQNQAIAQTKTSWVLALNPDVRVPPGFLSRLVETGSGDERIGIVCGKLLTMTPDFQSPFETGRTPTIDSTGIYFTPEQRHFDRGSQDEDRGQFERKELVFGATGAAALYRRAMIDDVSVDGEFFDEDFFAYREDADLSWRAQLLGWHCLYTPAAIAFHVRSVLPTNRKDVPAAVNRHSVKNRFLMRIKNMDGQLYRRNWLPITLRDAFIVAGCVLREQSSLPAFWFILRQWKKTWAKRRAIMRRRRVTPAEISRWFANEPVALPAPQFAAKRGQD